MQAKRIFTDLIDCFTSHKIGSNKDNFIYQFIKGLLHFHRTNLSIKVYHN